MPKAGPKITTVCEWCKMSFDRIPAFHRSAEAKGGKVRFCSSKCFGEAKTAGLVVNTKKRGKLTFRCQMCGTQFERWPSNLKWGTIRGSGVRFCSLECHGKARTARLILLPAHPTEGSRKKSNSCRARWGLPPHPPELMNLTRPVRARLSRGIGFNASQLKNWKTTECAKCGATENLQLDHIVCMAAGGKSVRENAQTLCSKCHRWKKVHVDQPLVRQQFLSGGD